MAMTSNTVSTLTRILEQFDESSKESLEYILYIYSREVENYNLSTNVEEDLKLFEKFLRHRFTVDELLYIFNVNAYYAYGGEIKEEEAFKIKNTLTGKIIRSFHISMAIKFEILVEIYIVLQVNYLRFHPTPYAGKEDLFTNFDNTNISILIMDDMDLKSPLIKNVEYISILYRKINNIEELESYYTHLYEEYMNDFKSKDKIGILLNNFDKGINSRYFNATKADVQRVHHEYLDIAVGRIGNDIDLAYRPVYFPRYDSENSKSFIVKPYDPNNPKKRLLGFFEFQSAFNEDNIASAGLAPY